MHLKSKEEKEIGINKHFLRGGFVVKKRIKEIVKRLKMIYSGLSLEDILLERNIVSFYLAIFYQFYLNLNIKRKENNRSIMKIMQKKIT